MHQHHVPEQMMAPVVSMACAMVRGEFDATSPVFEQLPGRPATSLQAYVEAVSQRNSQLAFYKPAD